MSAHNPMPRSAWIFPALAVLLFVAVSPAVGVATYALGKELTLGLSARAACFCS